jgi:catechol 2,3-dioxygenase-like lactoylglutathione lyase family enzyme
VAKLTGLAPVLLVPEVQEALDWYRDKLGFDVETWEPAPATYGYARRDGCNIHVSHGEAPRPNSEIVQPDLFDVYLWTDDVEALHREFTASGANVLHEPMERPWGMREIRVEDPFGYILAFGEPLASPPTLRA